MPAAKCVRLTYDSTVLYDDMSNGGGFACDMENAIRMNADCVAVQTFIGAPGESRSLELLCRAADAGARYGIPTLGVVAVGKRLTVLAYREDGLEKLFDCRIMDLNILYREEEPCFIWEDENGDPGQVDMVCSPLKSDWEDDFEHMSMVLKDGKLAIAWNESGRTIDVMVEVYSAEGLVYAQGIRCGLHHQGAGQTVRAMQRPNIAWSS